MHITVDLTDTPGVYYALGYWLSSMLYIYRTGPLVRGRAQHLREGLCLLFWAFFMTVTHMLPQWCFPALMLAIFGMICAFIGISCGLDRRGSFYVGMRAFMLGEFASSLEWQIFYYALTRMGFPLRMDVNLVCLTLIHSGVFFLMYDLERRFGCDIQGRKFTDQFLGAMATITLMAYLLSNISFVLRDTPFSAQYPAEIFMVRTMADLFGVAALFACSMLEKSMQEQIRAESMQAALDLQYENYRLTEESVALVGRKYHDLKHQIAYLKSHISDEEKTRSLTRIEEEIHQFEDLNRTGNPVLDTIVTSKSILCHKEGIALHCVADGRTLSFMDPMDLTALFGNILDNSMEAVRKIPDPEQRLIRLAVSRQKGFVRIVAENRYAGEIVFREGLPLTSKQDPGYHGYGVSSIKNTVEKYGGSTRIQTRDGWFCLNILIPAAEKA